MPLMSRVLEVEGVGLSDPIQRAHKEKQANTPALDKGCHGNPSPLGHRISRESTESVCLGERRVWSCLRQKSYVIGAVLATGGRGRTAAERGGCWTRGFSPLPE